MNKTKLTNLQVVIVAVARLGGETQSIHTEDVAIEVSKIAPNRFAWRKYPEKIDLELVRRTLATATEKKPPLLVGSVRRGWMLSKDGIRWLDKMSRELPAATGYRRGSISDAIEIEKMRLRETSAWHKFKAGKSSQININDLYEFARINEYFSQAKRLERLNIVSSAVDGDSELSNLWNLLMERFPKELRGNSK